MSVFTYGKVIRLRRESLGISQETLADGVCSVSTLSRIENGERRPTKETMELLLQRVGLSENPIEYYTDEESFAIHQLKIRIPLAMQEGKYDKAKYDEAKRLYQELADRLVNPVPLNRQFLLFYETILYRERFTPQTRLEQLETAMRLTCPRYDPDRLPQVMAYSEILTLNGIALCYSELGKSEETIRILYHILGFYDRAIVNQEEVWRTSPMIYYNLSKYLGLAGRYDECVEVCEQGIRMSNLSGRASRLARIYFNCAWALLRRGASGDREKAEKYARYACYMGRAMEQPEISAFLEFYHKNWDKNISI